MMEVTFNDVATVANAVRIFLGKTGLMGRLSTQAHLVFSFADLAVMREVHTQMQRTMQPYMVKEKNLFQERFVDDGTLEMEVCGIMVTLHCNQRIMLRNGQMVGYRHIKWNMPKKEAP